jgi:hypothetical protein
MVQLDEEPVRDLEGAFEAEDVARGAAEAGVPSTRLTRAAEYGKQAAGMAGSALQSGASAAASIGGAAASAVLGGTVAAASAAGSLAQEYGPGIARAAASGVAGELAALPDAISTGLMVASIAASLVKDALIASVAPRRPEYDYVFTSPKTFRRSNYGIYDLSPEQLIARQQEMSGDPYDEPQPARRGLTIPTQPEVFGSLTMGVPPPPSQSASSSMGAPPPPQAALTSWADYEEPRNVFFSSRYDA